MEVFDIPSRMCEIKLFREESLVLSAIFIPAGTQDHGDRAPVRLGARRPLSVIPNTGDSKV